MSNNNARPPTTENGTLQTWLPYPNYAESAHVLDTKRLSKQRTNVLEILDVLHEVNQQSKFYEHPVIEMWRGYEPQLCEYGLVVCEEYKSRGHLEKCSARVSWHLDCATSGEFTMNKPPWFGHPGIHVSHRSALLRKDPDYYWRFFSGIPDDLPMIWPTAS